MNNFIYPRTITTETLVCSCANRHLLLAGDVCDLCMGVVVEGDPVDALPARSESEDLYDESYFEALESYYEDITYAA